MSEIIPFGKYKGKPIIEVISKHKKYIEWLMLQNWLSEELRSQINVFITHGGKNSEETPEHNRIQMIFLNREYRRAICSFFYRCPIIPKKVSFEAKVGAIFADVFFDFKTKGVTSSSRVCDKCKENTLFSRNYAFMEKPVMCDSCGRERPTSFDFKYYNPISGKMFIEIKPSVSDEYPSVLRQIKRMQEEAERGCFVLLYGSFDSKYVSEDEFVEIFESSKIKCVSMKQLEEKRLHLIEIDESTKKDFAERGVEFDEYFYEE